MTYKTATNVAIKNPPPKFDINAESASASIFKDEGGLKTSASGFEGCGLPRLGVGRRARLLSISAAIAA